MTSEYLIEDCIYQVLSEGPISPRKLLGEVQTTLGTEDPSYIKRQMRIMIYNGDIYLDHDMKYTTESRGCSIEEVQDDEET